MAATEDLFTAVHKGLRSMLYDLSERLQTNDFADVAATSALIVQLESDFAVARSTGCALCTMSHHAHSEESVVFPPAAAPANALVTQLILEHHDLTRREVALAQAGHELVRLDSPDRRIAAGVRLNQGANQLLCAYLTHMDREEAELVPLMQQHFTDAQMVSMRDAIIRSMSPEVLFAFLNWMLPSLNVNELSELLASVRLSAPPPVFKAITDLCAAKVESSRWATTKSRIGL